MALGEKLKKARLDKGLTASEVAAMTRMKFQMVEDLEREDFSKVAATIYGKGFIRLYAEQVGLDPAPLIDEYLTRFVNPAHDGKRPRNESEPEEEDEFEEDESKNDILKRVLSFFRSSDESAKQVEDLEPEPKTPYFPPKREAPVRQSEPEIYEQESVKPEPVRKAVSRPEPERDLFSMTQPELSKERQEVEYEPEEEDQPEVEPDHVDRDEDELDEDAARSFVEVLGDKLDVFKEIVSEVWYRFQQVCSDIALDLKIQSKKLLERLPDVRSLDLSWNSIPVLITLLLIAVLLVSGLASIILRAGSDTEVTEEVVVEEQTQEQILRIVVNPPEPYYK